VTFDDFFRCAFGGQKGNHFKPFDYQRRLALGGFGKGGKAAWPDLLEVPTGMGKTAAVVLAWLWKRGWRKGGREGRPDTDTPRRLVYCLPMRVLVEQTYRNVQGWLKNLGILADPDHGKVSVHLLMGGSDDVAQGTWAEYPEEDMVLIGTQDMLLSRALNRGYSMSRFDWPVHFGLLNNDCLWIFDEVQLMGPSLWTSAQLDWMRKKRFRTLFDCPTVWMSATAGKSFLDTQDRKADGLTKGNSLPKGLIDNDRHPEALRRRAARKFVTAWHQPKPKKGKKDDGAFYQALADDVRKHHLSGTLTLVVCNTVEVARQIFQRLPETNPPKVLLTSRFRRQDREKHERLLLNFEARRKQVEAERERDGYGDEVGKPLPDDPGLICVSTQVVEAGLDVSAHQLWSEIAPWPSMIQRLGRLNRDGRDQGAKAWFWEVPTAASRKKKTKQENEQNGQFGPYDVEDLSRGKSLLEALTQSDMQKPFAEVLKALECQHKAELDQALEPKPEPMPRALDVHGLFSTERDVHGGFTDVSAFVRGSDPEADLTVVWRTWEGGAKKSPPSGDDLDGPPLDVATEGCPVPFYRLRDSLKSTKARAWLWNDEEDRWQEIRSDDLRPGMVVMLHREAGGYSSTLGWTGERSDTLEDVPRAGKGRALRDDERTEIGYWSTLDAHLRDAQCQARQLCALLGIPSDLSKNVIEAAGLHDLGKAHPQWQQALPAVTAIGSGPWAKCPRVLGVDVVSDDVRCAVSRKVRGVRSNALALPEEKRRRNGKEVVRLLWALDESLTRDELDSLRNELRALSGVLWSGHVPFRPHMRHEAASALAMWQRYRQGNASYHALAVYLAAAHHGKLRTVFRSLTENGDDAFGVPADSAPLNVNGEQWPLDFSVVKDGAEGTWTGQGFLLEGYGWTGLVADLLGPWNPKDPSHAAVVPDGEPKNLGPFKLAYLEALVRIADWRASKLPSQCTKPSEVRRGE
jgi:CRISPR-associated endonuclease/helicase Cas3